MKRDAEQWRDEIALREASLVDARRELASGDLSQRAFAAIETRESAAMSRARAALAPLLGSVAVPPARPRVRRARWLGVALVAFGLALGVLLWSALGPRQANTSGTGAITLGHAQQIRQLLNEAEADIANGQPVTALEAYRQVLALDANNVAALTQTGWLDFSAGSSDRNSVLTTLGVGYLRRAVTLAPRQPAARLYYAIVADSTPGNRALARRQFTIFLALKPSPALVGVATPFLRRLGLAAS